MRRTRVHLHLTAEGRETAASSFRGIDLDRRIDSRSGRLYLRCKIRDAPAVTIAATARRPARLAFDGEMHLTRRKCQVLRTVSARESLPLCKRNARTKQKKKKERKRCVTRSPFTSLFSRHEPLHPPFCLSLHLSSSLVRSSRWRGP